MCRQPRYVVVAHSLGSVMSFDALMYARAKATVRNGNCKDWEFPGYLEPTNEGNGKTPSTEWIGRVASFVTLGSPIDKYLMIWWMNYQYLCTDAQLVNTNHTNGCRIQHFNFCDELDPVGHHLEVVSGTVAYNRVFEQCEDIVFNRYGVPGVAHNDYWADQELWRWILARSVDATPRQSAPALTWFERKKYLQLLRWLYCYVPSAVVVVGYAALTLALAASSWQMAVLSAAMFALVLHLGRRLVDLSVWWRQVQREEGDVARERNNNEQNETKSDRDKAARRFRRWATVLPLLFAMLGFIGFWLTMSSRFQGIDQRHFDWMHLLNVGISKGALVAVTVVVFFLFLWSNSRRRLPPAYQTAASGEDDGASAQIVALTFGVLPLGLAVATGLACPLLALTELPKVIADCVANLSILLVFMSVVWAYRWQRFLNVKKRVRRESREKRDEICYAKYVNNPTDTGDE